MKVDIATKKKEAIERMKSIGIASCIINDFARNNNVQVFETSLGIGYWASDKIKAAIEDFQKEFNALVYGGIKTPFRDGAVHVALFYVSDHEDEWASDRADLKAGCTCAYVHNETDPWCSEVGYVNFRVNRASGGMVRTA